MKMILHEMSIKKETISVLFAPHFQYVIIRTSVRTSQELVLTDRLYTSSVNEGIGVSTRSDSNQEMLLTLDVFKDTLYNLYNPCSGGLTLRSVLSMDASNKPTIHTTFWHASTDWHALQQP